MTTAETKTPKKAVAKRVPKPKPVGRPSKATDEVFQKITDAVKAGVWIEQAAHLAAIHPSTLYEWVSKGERAREMEELTGEPMSEQDLRLAEFSESLKRARAEAEARNITLIQKAAQDGTWQAAAWYLERSAPHRWGRRDRMEITGKEGGSIEVSVSSADLEAKVLTLLSERTNQPE